MSDGSAGSEELSERTSTISSRMYLKNRRMLKPASAATAPRTTNTNSRLVTQKVTISCASGPSELRP